ncbi:TPA: hypothetical protein RKY22_004909 [Klebsiella michiganensis]|nr:hypothetical protein [Klebsiella michiganensis]
MKLVEKDKNHTTNYILCEDEKNAILNFCGAGLTASSEEEDTARRIIRKMDKNGLYLECDCLPPGANQAWNCEVGSTFLRRGKTSSEHNRQCPLYHLKKSGTEKSDVERVGEGDIAPLVPVDINDIFSRKTTPGESGGKTLLHGQRRRSRLKPVPKLGRQLFTLLQGAGINTIALLPNPTTPGLTAVLSALSSYIKTLTFKNGVTASRVITTWTNITQDDQNKMMSYLEKPDLEWEGDRNREFFLIGITEKLSQREVIFKHKGIELPPFTTAKTIKTFAESITNIGLKPPYWVILRFLRGEDGQVYCDEGYAHCAYTKQNPIPVDSDKERETLRTIVRAAAFVRQQNAKAGKPVPSVTLKKPLFTATVHGNDGEAMEVHPDFQLSVLSAGRQDPDNFVVETMGYDSLEYIERKLRTHPGMRELGYLLTDPHGFPEKTERTFYQEMLSCLFYPEKHRQA